MGLSRGVLSIAELSITGIFRVFLCGARCFGLPKSGRKDIRIRVRGAIMSYIYRIGEEGGGNKLPDAAYV